MLRRLAPMIFLCSKAASLQRAPQVPGQVVQSPSLAPLLRFAAAAAEAKRFV